MNNYYFLSWWLLNIAFATSNLITVIYVQYKNKCQCTCILQITSAVYTVIFLCKAVSGGFLYFDYRHYSPADTLVLSLNWETIAIVTTLYVMIALKTLQVHYRLSEEKDDFSAGSVLHNSRGKVKKRGIRDGCIYCVSLSYGLVFSTMVWV